MSERIVVIATPPIVMGFRLVGIEGRVVTTPKELEKELSSALEDPGIGVIAVDEGLYAKIDWRLKKRIEGIAHPVVVPISSRETSSEESLEVLIKRALGFEIKKKKG